MRSSRAGRGGAEGGPCFWWGEEGGADKGVEFYGEDAVGGAGDLGFFLEGQGGEAPEPVRDEVEECVGLFA